MQSTKIEWADMTWNPVSGCTKVSPGCKYCYAETIHKRFQKKLGDFNKITLHPEKLTEPLRHKKPKRIFVNSMSDLFHEDVPFEFIQAVFSVMADVNQHTYMILTKRPERLLQFHEWMMERLYVRWNPSPNVWLGVSVENQAEADKRIPLLLQIPAAVRFLSCEPLIGRVDIVQCIQDAFNDKRLPLSRWGSSCFEGIHWVIAGGESGHHARPMHPEWVRLIRDQCITARVPFFFKQWGTFEPNRIPFRSYENWVNKAQTWLQGWRRGRDLCIDENGSPCLKGSDFKTAQYPVYPMWKVGKNKSGNTLDGQTHLEFPKTIQP